MPNLVSQDIFAAYLEKFSVEACPLHGMEMALTADEHGHTTAKCPKCVVDMELPHILAVKQQRNVMEVCSALNSRHTWVHPTIPTLPQRFNSAPRELPPVEPGDSYWSSRGLSWGTLRTFGAGISAGLPALPVTVDGELLGILQRDPTIPADTHMAPGKYREIGAARRGFVGFDQARRLAMPFRVLTEGAVDAMHTWEAGMPALGLLGIALSWNQLRLLLPETRNLVLALDNDPYGARFFESELYRGFVVPFFKTTVAALPADTDPGALSPQALNRVLSRAVHELNLGGN